MKLDATRTWLCFQESPFAPAKVAGDLSCPEQKETECCLGTLPNVSRLVEFLR